MPQRGYSIQTNFSAGMLDLSSISRFDVEAYKAGGLDITNMLGLPLGGVTLRGGLAHFATVASGGANGRLLRFEFSTEQVYLMLVRALAIDVYLPDGTLAATVTTTYAADEIAALSWVQSLDTLILVHPNHAPARLVRSGSHSEWVLSDLVLTNIPTYKFDGTTAEPVWSAARGWPRSVFLHQGRLYFGGSKSRPQTVWGSTANSFFDFATTDDALDDEAVELTFDNDRVCAVQQLYALNDFFAFTTGGLFARVSDNPVSPNAFTMARSSEVPAARLRPAEIDGSVMYASYGEESGFSTIYEVIFDYDTQSYRAEDVALLSGHLMRRPVDMAARLGNETDSANHLYVVNGGDGTVAVLNSRKVQKMTGWTLLRTGGEILSVAVVGNLPYFLIRRTVAGATVHTIERLDPERRLDCSVTLTAETPTDEWSAAALAFYNGATVDLIGDGAPLGQAEVAGGALTTSYPVLALEVGFAFDWAVETMPAMVDGSEIMERHRIVRASVVVERTAGMAVNGRPIADQFVGPDLLDRPAQPFTGTKQIRFLGWKGGRVGGIGATVRITGTSANPATILAVAAEVAK
jgi:hypothetical protein